MPGFILMYKHILYSNMQKWEAHKKKVCFCVWCVENVKHILLLNNYTHIHTYHNNGVLAIDSLSVT